MPSTSRFTFQRWSIVGGAVGLALALAACTGSNPTPQITTHTVTSTTTVTAMPPVTSSPTSTPATPVTPDGFGLASVESPGWPDSPGSPGLGRAIRVGVHQAYDRVVYEFAGSGLPGYAVGYTDQPVGENSGEPIHVAGQAVLQVMLSGIPLDNGPDLKPPTLPAGTFIVQADPVTSGFEGHAQSFIGITGHQRPFRVTTATNPSRLIIDIAHL